MTAHTGELAFSAVGEKLTGHSGILELMDELGRAMTIDPQMRMLGGGNPAAVPGLQELVRARMMELLAEGDAFDRMLANYEPPRGNPRFLRALAELFRREFGWDIGPENIAVTAGGQSAYFYLFNLLAGRFCDGRRRKILLPLTPEYIGYADQGLEADLFVACRPVIEAAPAGVRHHFKYHIDFPTVEAALNENDIAAIAVSRPTNPTGNVLTDAEVERLSALAAARGVPLILDNAYGAPFPNVMFVPARPHWAPHVILTLSLSKLGLPGTRTGIVIGPEKIIAAIAGLTAIVGLANNTVGQQLVLPWIENGRILRFGPELLRPFYAERSRVAEQWAVEAFGAHGVEWRMHVSEGAFFHWFCLPRLTIPTRVLYARLKSRRVLTVPGEYFFFGLREDWSHAHECLRVNFSGPPEVVREGLQIIAEEAAQTQL